MKKISVIVPCYNAADYLGKCIEQLLCQTIGIDHIEIILVDDASTDEGATKKMIQKYEQQFPDTVKAVFLTQNMRQGGARNVGIAYAEGEYITFCDADDWLLKETLEHSYHAAKEHGADIVSFARKCVSTRDNFENVERGGKSRLCELDTLKKKKAFLLNRQEEDYGSQNKLFRLSMIRKNQISFAEYYSMEEAAFTIPARLYAKKIYYLDEKLYIYYLSPGSTMRGDDWEKRKWDNLQVWMIIMEELKSRGFFQDYCKEIEYLFFTQGIAWGLGFLFKRGSILTKEEWESVADTVEKMIPDIRKNPYIISEDNLFDRLWNDLVLRSLEMKFSDESAEQVNRAMREAMQ